MIAPDGGVVTNLIVRGELGTMTAINPLAPQNGAGIVVETADQRSELEVATSASYYHQLVAFRDAIADGTPFPTTADDGVRNMEVIDACYRAAGLQPRPSPAKSAGLEIIDELAMIVALLGDIANHFDLAVFAAQQ